MVVNLWATTMITSIEIVLLVLLHVQKHWIIAPCTIGSTRLSWSQCVRCSRQTPLELNHNIVTGKGSSNMGRDKIKEHRLHSLMRVI